MEKTNQLGVNKTGIDMSPLMSEDMMDTEGLYMGETHATGAREEMQQYYLMDSDTLGSVPLPGTVKGVVKSTMKMATGKHPETFINKLGERLAYERSGVRIYEQLIAKCEHGRVGNQDDFRLPVERIREFRDQEAEHFEMLIECMKQLGADPTAQTPDADASGVAASGLMKIIMDPRTSLSQSLEAMLTLELTDNAAWELLIKLADDMSLKEMVSKFEHAYEQEETHLREVRQWYEQSVRKQGIIT